jgi:putative multiple sugar transport system ATP-binding protein
MSGIVIEMFIAIPALSVLLLRGRNMSGFILEMHQISKEFTGVKALSNVNFKVEKGEIHCLIGENGAGKSTLMKVLSGVYPYGTYEGDILFEGSVQQFNKISDSVKTGIAIIYQELALFPDLTVYENIFAGNEVKQGGIIDWNRTIKEAKKLLEKVKLKVTPDTLVKDLSVGKRQLVEIAKALSKDVKLLILDEPTAALNEDDSENLLELLSELKNQGITCIMISHKLKEVISIADKATVIRDGKTICTLDAAKGEISESVIIKNMVGREIEDIYPKREKKVFGEKILELHNWSAYDPQLGRQVVKDVDFHVKKGEIVGIAGLMGSGRTELALSIFGNAKSYKLQGDLTLDGSIATLKHTSDAINAGIAYVTEDRKDDGLFLLQDIKSNISAANLKGISTKGVINENEEIKAADRYKNSLHIKTSTLEQLVGNLSGGNQQKVSIGKWLFVGPKLLILDEPTRGIDVGAKFEIYSVMNKLIDEGLSIVMISSELGEVLGMSDRVYVMAQGKIKGELQIEEADQEKIMQLATQ